MNNRLGRNKRLPNPQPLRTRLALHTRRNGRVEAEGLVDDGVEMREFDEVFGGYVGNVFV
jgi:hypothetical protein